MTLPSEFESIIGTSVHGYKFKELLGKGGFGAVFSAYQTILDRDVAIKIILPMHANDPKFIKQFDVEAQLVARLEHPHIVPLFDFWREPTGGAYFVSRLLTGGSLRGRIQSGQTLDAATVLKFIEQIGDALDFAHRNNVIHRDLKPDNILIDDQGNFYLADFGIAFQTDKIDPADAEEFYSGTVHYSSLEQFEGRPPKPQIDIYSLGYIIHELLNGKYILADLSTTQIIHHHMYEKLPELSDYPYQINEILDKATQRKPEDRYDSMRELVEALRHAFYSEELVPVPGGFAFVEDAFEVYRRNPYKGLRAFEISDAMDFYGRDAQVDRLMDAMTHDDTYTRFLCLVGASGSGKSSLVKAGLIPALLSGRLYSSENWFYADMVCGSEPVNALVSALTQISPIDINRIAETIETHESGLHSIVKQITKGYELTDIVLFIDQFEELFLSGADESRIQMFLDNLTYAVNAPDSQLHVIVTIRADFYDRPLAYEGFSSLVRDHNDVILPLSSTDVREIIVRPAESVGMTIEDTLLAQLINDVTAQAGSLPLLEYTLSELYESASESIMTLEDYQRIGGLTGALSLQATRLYESLSASDQQLIKRLFLQLVNISRDAPETRRRVRWSTLRGIFDNHHQLQTAVDQFVKNRFLTVDSDNVDREPTVEIAHESLLRDWQLLRQWVDENGNDLLQQNILQTATEQWLDGKKDESFLLRGARLEQFNEWKQSTNLDLTGDQMKLLGASNLAHQQQLAREREQLEREQQLEQRARRRLQAMLGIAIIAAIMGSGLALLAFNQSSIANDERDNRATQQAIANDERDNRATQQAIAESNEAQAQENLIIAETNEARALSAEATAVRQASEANSLLLVAEAQNRLREYLPNQALQLLLEANAIENPPVGAQGLLYETAYMPAILDKTQSDAELVSVATSPDHSQIWVGTLDGTLLTYDMDSLELLKETQVTESAITNLLFVDAETLIFSSADSNVVTRWDVTNAEVIDILDVSESTITALALDPQSSMLALGNQTGQVLLVDLKDSDETRIINAHDETVNDIVFHPSRPMIATASDDQTVAIWGTLTGEPIYVLEGHDDWVLAVAFSSDGEKLVTSSFDDTMHIWDMETGALDGVLTGHRDTVADAQFVDEDTRIVSISADGDMRLWEVETLQTIKILADDDTGITAFTISPDDEQVVTINAVGQVTTWAITNGALVSRFPAEHTSIVTGLDVSSDNQYAVSVGFDNRPIIWDLQTAQPIIVEALNNFVTNVTFTADNSTIITGGQDGMITIFSFDAETMTLTTVDEYQQDRPLSSVQVISETQILMGDNDGNIRLMDFSNGEIIQSWKADEGIVLIVWMPETQTFLTSDSSQHVMIWGINDSEPQARVESEILITAILPVDESFLLGDGVGRMWEWDGQSDMLALIGRWHSDVIWQITRFDDKLITSSGDSNVTVWALDGQQLFTFDGHPVGVFALAVFADETRLMTGDDVGRIRIWRLDSLASIKQWVAENRLIEMNTR